MINEPDFSKLNSDNLQEKLFFLKELTIYSRKEPMKVYPHFDEISSYLQSDKKVLIWNAMRIIATLALVDTGQKIESVLDDIIAKLNRGCLITATTAMETLGAIAYAKRNLTELIVVNLLQVVNYRYETDEASNIAIGKAIAVLTKLYPITDKKAAVKNMAMQHLRSERPATLANAEELFRKLDDAKN